MGEQKSIWREKTIVFVVFKQEMSGAPFPILLANGLAVTAPDGGVEGRLTLAPYDAADPKQKYVFIFLIIIIIIC